MKIHGRINGIDHVAVSGGIDSMVLLDFCKVHKISAVHFNHGTKHADDAEKFVTDYCNQNNIGLTIGRISGPKLEGSWESYWRNQRYNYFNNIDGIIATAHHFDDVIETYVMCFIKQIKRRFYYKINNIVRPLISTKKDEIVEWANRKGIPYIDDPSNNSLCHDRNRIRHEILPSILRVNPGFYGNVMNDIDFENESNDSYKFTVVA